jgi:membrane-bound ClpP family serine protease
VRFVSALTTDRRIALLSKLLYVAGLALLLVALLVPEGILATLVAVVLPVVGPAINLPADGLVDWAVVGLAAYGLLTLFPRAIVSEHHARLFHPRRVARQQQQHLRPRG